MFRLSIETGNAAFAGDPAREIARILRALAERLDAAPLADGEALALRDENGNRVGAAEYRGDDCDDCDDCDD